MKKVNLKAYLMAAFCLIIFAGFTLAQTESAKPGDVAKTDSNEIELARQKKHLQLQKQLMLKRWRRLKPGMTEKQVQKILGKPKLIQGGSDECVWFYQFLPVSVGGVKDGCVFFEAKSLDSLIKEGKAKLDKIIAEERARCGSAIVMEQTRCKNAIKQIMARPPANEAMRRMRDTAIATHKAMRDNAIAQHEIRRNIAITRAESKYKGQVKRLRDRPLSPVFVLSSFNHPDWGRFEELLANKKPGGIKPSGPIDKWKMPLSWRKLRINMKPGQVHALLGEPERIKTSVEGRREYYGDISGHGELYFTARPDLEEYLDSWIEPFWPAVEKELALSPRVEQEKVAMPEYSVLNEDVYDIPLKTQVELNILVSGEISGTGLKALLEKLYSSTKAKKGFKYHDSPTNIYIYAFTSKEGAESGMGQWIAMLQESPGDLRPRISINKRQIARLSAEPEERFGLSEAKRIEIWKEYVLAEDEAWQKAEEKYSFHPGLSQSQFRKQAEKLMEFRQQLEKQYKAELAKKHGLTLDQLKEIADEGVTKDWPFPKSTAVPPVSEKSVAENKPIGISYYQVMEYLSNFFSMEKSTPVHGQERYMGQTSDSLAVLEIIGNKNNISQATLMIGIPADAPDKLVRNTVLATRFLENTVPEWTNSNEWITANAERVADTPGISDVKVVKGNKLITMTFLKPFGMLSLTVKHK